MRVLLFAVLMSLACTSFANNVTGQLRETSYAPPVDVNGWKHRFDFYYGDGFGNYWDLNCKQVHQNGRYYHKYHGRYYPMYRYPRFGYYGHHYHPFFMKQSTGRHSHGHPKGFYRCWNREGLSVECYQQSGKRG